MINILLSLLLATAALLPMGLSADPPTPGDTCREVEIYSREDCPHCAKAHDYFDDLKKEHPQLRIRAYEISESEAVWQRFIQINRQLDIDRPGVPLILVCKEFMVGFDSPATSGMTIEKWLGLEAGREDSGAEDEIAAPWLGTLSVSALGLPVFTMLIGLVDGFNPCAMWVLLMLLSLLVNLRDRRRILLVAGIFVLVSGLVYFAFMAAWLNLFLIIGYSRLIQLVVGALALLVGAIHMKDYVAFKKGISLSIPESARRPIYLRIRRVLNAEDLFAALVGISILALLVNLVELLCTAGLPALYTQILTNRGLSSLQYYAYLALYNLAYMFDDMIMVGIAVYTLGSKRLQEGGGRWLKLLSGGIIFLLGLLLVFAPEFLF